MQNTATILVSADEITVVDGKFSHSVSVKFEHARSRSYPSLYKALPK